jgi:hypothetical protein
MCEKDDDKINFHFPPGLHRRISIALSIRKMNQEIPWTLPHPWRSLRLHWSQVEMKTNNYPLRESKKMDRMTHQIPHVHSFPTKSRSNDVETRIRLQRLPKKTKKR